MTMWRSAGAGALAAVLSATAASAALPPYHQRVLEFETILKNAEVARALAGKGPIDGVARTGEDEYVVEADKCTLRVKVLPADGPQTAPGPRRIKLEVGTPTCP